ncbi:RPN9 [Candida pseudojiufengensis]|uniref:RPN9 n=1 Tax=Candida pseudojiufengensis TaxID=497109 RepID=UPI0022242EF9|nr:RPN9 [Candida pseudojiufengensis]KAI5960661.1 RPN9 [Candida pseudojiufengensis]
MSAMDIDSDISTLLASIRSELESPELINIFYQLEDFYERKLWHQLTQILDEFYYTYDQTQINQELKNKLYSLFIQQFQSKLNSIKVVDFLLESYPTNETLDKLIQLRKEFVDNLKKENNYKDDEDPEYKKLLENDESLIYIDLQIARYNLYLEKLEEAEITLSRIEPKFESLNNEYNSKINAAYYLTKCQLYKLTKNYNEFYKNGLLYLSSVSSLNQDEKIKLCYDLCISALLGDKVYNFGELILHEILQEFNNENSNYYWLYQLIQNLNSGNLKEFNKWKIIAFEKSPFLKNHELFLNQKIIIMSLLELISLKSTTNKRLTFKEITEFTGTPINDVEHLIIKCFSLKLIQGYINQIDEILIVTWLQPRILNLNQVHSLYTHLVDWDNKVEQLGKVVYQSGGTVWAGL